MSMWYGLAWYRNPEGERVNVIIRGLKSRDRLGAKLEALRVCRNRGYRFDDVYLAANHRNHGGEEVIRAMPDSLLWITEACDGDRYDRWLREHWTLEDAIRGYSILQAAVEAAFGKGWS